MASLTSTGTPELNLEAPAPEEGNVRRTIRFSIAGLMGIVVVAAIGLAALRNASETWAGVMLLFTFGVLLLAVVGVVCRGEAERAWWLGFALFGWGYMALALWSLSNNRAASLPTIAWLNALTTKLGVTPQGMNAGSGMGGMGGMGGGMRSVLPVQFDAVMFGGGVGGNAPGFGADAWYAEVAHSLWALIFAILGGTLSRILFAIPGSRSEPRRDDTERAGPGRPGEKRWVRPAGVAVTGLVLVALLGAVRARSAPGLGAGAAFLLTCGVIGLTALGAVLDRGRRGEIWLGAALFGAGYMIVAFARDPSPYPIPQLPTDQLLISLKPWFPRAGEGLFVSSDNIASANARITTALDQPVPMHFHDETPLDDVLKHIQKETKGPDGKLLPIYVDPIGLQEAEKSINSTVTIDIEGVPLKSTLGLCLKQLGLRYWIRDGVLLITSAEAEEIPPPVCEDPFRIVGHCVLTVLAAVLGGVLAPLVAGSRRASR
jgi:hypothetical protein